MKTSLKISWNGTIIIVRPTERRNTNVKKVKADAFSYLFGLWNVGVGAFSANKEITESMEGMERGETSEE